MGSMHGDWGLGTGFGMWIFWIIIALVIVLLIRGLINGASTPPATTKESPMDLLKKRYASGEIEQQEYERIKNELENSNNSANK